MPEKEPVVVTTVAADIDAKSIGTEDFTKKLLAEFHSKNVWRKLESLAKSLNVDTQQLRQYLDEMPGVIRKKGKEDTFFYCWEERITPEEEPKKKEKEKLLQRPAVKEEDRYAQAIMHMIFYNFHLALKTYALEISQTSNEAFNNFTTALDSLEAGLILFSGKTGVNIDKLPKFG
jgi:hypothetical protein